MNSKENKKYMGMLRGRTWKKGGGNYVLIISTTKRSDKDEFCSCCKYKLSDCVKVYKHYIIKGKIHVLSLGVEIDTMFFKLRTSYTLILVMAPSMSMHQVPGLWHRTHNGKHKALSLEK